MEGSSSSDNNDVVAEENIDDNAASPVAPELFDTSSLTRRLARGEYTESIARKITEQEEIGVMLPSTTMSSAAAGVTSSMTSEASFEPCPRGITAISASVKRELFEEIGEEESGPNQSALSSELNNVPPQTPVRPQSIEVPSSTNSNKSALDSFSEYISFFFKNAENYEEMLERSESQRDLKVLADGKRDSQEAMAAVEAICNFRSLREVKKEIMDRGTPKKQNVNDSGIADSDIDKLWRSFCSEKKSHKFNELGLESIPLPVSVNDFYNHVLDDNAPHSIDKFMRDIGELEVESTSWQPSNPTSTDPANRSIVYIHPINAPMAPPTAAARKEQTLHKFGNTGLCLETSTFVEDVPMADCFIVRDRLWVK
mmetsp:Transcript_10273/g.16965  ORF Transcript_10273/g.16965 Transcript_10273/m.16965 type:complete len:370 (+) Transcript_10273:65-1174(+)